MSDSTSPPGSPKDSKREDEKNVDDSADNAPEPSSQEESATPPSPTAWQAIWSPQYNSYYFFNSQTKETTWTNPLASTEPQPAESSSKTPNTETPAQLDALQAAAIAQGIDPSLAYLDPSLAGPSGSAAQMAFTAKFNARSGAFARPDARDPTHMSEYERAKRMSQFYFDVGAWEQDVAKRHEEEAEGGKKRKRPTKKDLERFKEQKKQKKIAKTAWLRT